MEKLVDIVSVWNGDVVFGICVGAVAAVFALAIVLRVRVGMNAVPVTVTSALTFAALCFFITTYGAQSVCSALYAALLILEGGILTIAASVVDAKTRAGNKRGTFSEPPVTVGETVVASESLPVEALTTNAIPIEEESETEAEVTATIPDSAMPEMTPEEVELAVSKAESDGTMGMDEAKSLIMQIAKLRALPGTDAACKVRLADLQKRITAIFAAEKTPT